MTTTGTPTILQRMHYAGHLDPKNKVHNGYISDAEGIPWPFELIPEHANLLALAAILGGPWWRERVREGWKFSLDFPDGWAIVKLETARPDPYEYSVISFGPDHLTALIRAWEEVES